VEPDEIAKQPEMIALKKAIKAVLDCTDTDYVIRFLRNLADGLEREIKAREK
jgi:hypothetical protein